MMVFIGYFFQLREIDQAGKLLKVKHRIVFAVVAEKGYVLAEIHVLKMISDKTAIASLDPLTKFLDYLLAVDHLFYDPTLRTIDKVSKQIDLFAAGDLTSDSLHGLRRV